jgi:Flp pilus assembly protein TadD
MLERALVLVKLGRHDEAASMLLEYLKQEPGDTTAHATLALCLNALGDPDAAELESRRALDLHPDQDTALRVLALIASDRGETSRALDYIAQAQRIDPQDPDHFATEAAVHCETEEWELAISAADKALAISPEHEYGLQLKALALMQLERHSEAAVFAERALSLNPENGPAHMVCGMACFFRGELAAAMRHLRESRRLEPVESPYRLGAFAVAMMAWGQYWFRPLRTMTAGVFSPNTVVARIRVLSRTLFGSVLGCAIFGGAFALTGSGEVLTLMVTCMLVAMPTFVALAFRSSLRVVPVAISAMAAIFGVSATVLPLFAPDKGPSVFYSLALLLIILAFVPAMATPWIGGFYYVRMILRGEDP